MGPSSPLLVGVLLVTLASVTGALAATLVANGQPRATIVLPAEAGKTVSW